MVELIVREGECVCVFWASFFLVILCQVRVLLTVHVICILFYL